jgi:hypothetical protein
MFSKLTVNVGKPCLFGIVAVSLQGCIYSDEPLLSENQNISDPALLGKYVAAKSELKISTIEVRLTGTQYRLLTLGDSNNILTVDLQMLTPPLYLAQVKIPKKIPKKTPKEYAYSYWLVYVSPGFLLLNDIPCNPEIKKQAGVKSNADSFDCTFSSRDDVIAVAQFAAKHFLDDPNQLTAWIKVYK